jgi:hypothetical protein
MHAVRANRAEMRSELLLDRYDTLIAFDPLADKFDI